MLQSPHKNSFFQHPVLQTAERGTPIKPRYPSGMVACGVGESLCVAEMGATHEAWVNSVDSCELVGFKTRIKLGPKSMV